MHTAQKNASQNFRAHKTRMAKAFKDGTSNENPDDLEVMRTVMDEKLATQIEKWGIGWYPPSWLTFLLLGIVADENERCPMLLNGAVSKLASSPFSALRAMGGKQTRRDLNKVTAGTEKEGGSGGKSSDEAKVVKFVITRETVVPTVDTMRQTRINELKLALDEYKLMVAEFPDEVQIAKDYKEARLEFLSLLRGKSTTSSSIANVLFTPSSEETHF